MQNDRWGAEIQVFSTASGDSDVDFYQKQSQKQEKCRREKGCKNTVSPGLDFAPRSHSKCRVESDYVWYF